jgi:alcohol dehydrogenase (NADP+)
MAHSKVPKIKLSSGAEMPTFGLGTWKVNPAERIAPKQTTRILKPAAGFSFICRKAWSKKMHFVF